MQGVGGPGSTLAGATPNYDTATLGSDVMGAGNIVQGLASGTPMGYAGAGISAAGMAAQNGAFGAGTADVGTGLGAASGLLGAYSGLTSGSATGEAQGAIQAASVGANAAAGLGSSTAAEVAPMLGGLATGVGAFAAMYGLGNFLNNWSNGPNNNWSIGQINSLLSGAKGGGPNLNAGSVLNPNGSINQQQAQDLTDLTQLQTGNFGQASSYIAQALNGMGYMPVAQQVALQGGYQPVREGGGAGSRFTQQF